MYSRNVSNVGLNISSVGGEDEHDDSLSPEGTALISDNRIKKIEKKKKCVWIMIFSMACCLFTIVMSFVIIKIAYDSSIEKSEMESVEEQ